jgi:adenylosuccinate synthase
MAGVVVLGAQWGDEGKGRFVDYLAKKAKYIVRFSGGNNAGHTVVYQGKKYLFTIVPSGALYKKKLMIAAGACFDPKILLLEIDSLKKMGFSVDLMIDPRTHIVMPYHRQRDVANEKQRGREGVGSVGFGVGYCFVDRARRGNLRFEDLINRKRLKGKLDYLYPRNKETLQKLYKVSIEPQIKIFKSLSEYGRRLKKYLGDVSYVVNHALKKKKMVLFEGSQGVLLDVNFGTYPYTTGSHIISGYVYPSVGLSPQPLQTIGVVKAFNSRAGGGPFPTEISIAKGPGKHILIKGGEFEEFPGVPVRPRRVGWLDLPMLRYAHALNNFSALGLTHIDTLGGLKKLNVCSHYLYQGKKRLYPQFPGMTDKVKPVYVSMKVWGKLDPSSIRHFADLPTGAKEYVKFIEKETKVPIKYISVGPERKAIILR